LFQNGQCSGGEGVKKGPKFESDMSDSGQVSGKGIYKNPEITYYFRGFPII